MGNSRPCKLTAARYINQPECQWWALPQFLNFYKVSLTEFHRLQVVGKHPAILYRALLDAAKGKANLAAGRHFWRHLTWSQRHKPLSRELGQRMARAFGCTAMIPLPVEGFLDQFYFEGDQVKSIVRGTFSYNDDDGESEREYWTTVGCASCGHEVHVREQMGDDTPAAFLKENEHDLGGFTHLSGPYCRCDQCDAVTRVKVSPAEDLPDAAYDDQDGREIWENYQDHLEHLVTELTKHLQASGMPKPDGLRIEVGHADWRGRDAWAECPLDGKELADKIKVNSDFTVSGGQLRCYQDGNAEMRCRLSHHDVPTGSPVTISPYWECELGDGNDSPDDHLDYAAARLSMAFTARIATTILTGEHRVFEYSKSHEFKMVSRHNLAGAIQWLAERCEIDAQGDLEGYDLAMALLLERLESDVLNTDLDPIRIRIENVRAVLDHWLDQPED
jgi:hypothetical protein